MVERLEDRLVPTGPGGTPQALINIGGGSDGKGNYIVIYGAANKDGNIGSFRDAINAVNAGKDTTIKFQIGDTGKVGSVATINLSQVPLPLISPPANSDGNFPVVTINGFTQSGSVPSNGVPSTAATCRALRFLSWLPM